LLGEAGFTVTSSDGADLSSLTLENGQPTCVVAAQDSRLHAAALASIEEAEKLLRSDQHRDQMVAMARALAEIA